MRSKSAVVAAVEMWATRQAAECGFAGALVLPPSYYKNVPDDGIVRYIDAIVTATADSAIPLYLFSCPIGRSISH
jgi:4-hydroxy-tetrahydrodipicolinate synthase